MNKFLIVINGESGSGKDTFVDMCKKSSKFLGVNTPITNLHRSDEAKRVLKSFGWDGERTPQVRNLLADLVEFGEETGHNNEKLFEVLDTLEGVIFYHSRDPKTISKIKEHYWFCENVQVVSLLVVRDKNIASEQDRWDIRNYKYDKVIENNSTLYGLEQKAKEFMLDLEV